MAPLLCVYTLFLSPPRRRLKYPLSLERVWCRHPSLPTTPTLNKSNHAVRVQAVQEGGVRLQAPPAPGLLRQGLPRPRRQCGVQAVPGHPGGPAQVRLRRAHGQEHDDEAVPAPVHRRDGRRQVGLPAGHAGRQRRPHLHGRRPGGRAVGDRQVQGRRARARRPDRPQRRDRPRRQHGPGPVPDVLLPGAEHPHQDQPRHGRNRVRRRPDQGGRQGRRVRSHAPVQAGHPPLLVRPGHPEGHRRGDDVRPQGPGHHGRGLAGQRAGGPAQRRGPGPGRGRRQPGDRHAHPHQRVQERPGPGRGDGLLLPAGRQGQGLPGRPVGVCRAVRRRRRQRRRWRWRRQEGGGQEGGVGGGGRRRHGLLPVRLSGGGRLVRPFFVRCMKEKGGSAGRGVWGSGRGSGVWRAQARCSL